jgi:threonylcarbamoyladenosine tRNA methylthiotransferase MtaB
VVLTGVDITGYGRDLPGGPALGALVKAVLRHVPELPRLRLSSIDSVEADAELVDAIATEPRLMPHLHLSLQAGDDLVLKRMKRRHGREDAIRFCREMRALRPDMVFGADIIAGFPTETERRSGAPSTSWRHAASPICTSSRSRPARAPPPPACRPCRATW